MIPRFASVMFGVAALALALGALAGCGAEEGPSQPRPSSAQAQATQGGFGHVQLRAAHHWPRLGRRERTDVELWAVFVHYWGGEPEDVARTLGIDTAEPTLRPGACAPVTPDVPLPVGEWDEDDEELAVELLDAGPVAVALPGHTELMTGSPYPELLPNVTGQHYRHSWSTRAEAVTTRRVSVIGLGEGDVRAFELTGIRGPGELRLTSVSGWRPGEGPVLLSRQDPLRLRWQPGRTPFETRVRLRWGRPRAHAGGEILCRPRAGGRLKVPPRWLARIPAGRMGTRVKLTVETTARAEQPGPLPGPMGVRVTQSDNLWLLLLR